MNFAFTHRKSNLIFIISFFCLSFFITLQTQGQETEKQEKDSTQRDESNFFSRFKFLQGKSDSAKLAREKRKIQRKEIKEAQRIAPDTTVFLPTNGRKWNVTGIRLGAELGKYGLQFIDPELQLSDAVIFGDTLGNLNYYELYADISINNKFFITATTGSLERDRRVTLRIVGLRNLASFYTTKGTYTRFGIDYNLLHRKTEEDAIFVGFRYGFSNFDHSVLYRTRPDYWSPEGRPPNFVEQSGLTASWYEITLGFKVRFFSNFYLGTTARLMNPLSVSESPDFNVNDIPGFGFYNDRTRYDATYYIMYQIPLWR